MTDQLCQLFFIYCSLAPHLMSQLFYQLFDFECFYVNTAEIFSFHSKRLGYRMFLLFP